MILKKGFTLSEIMIAMAVLGIIIAACVPIIMNMSPNTNAIMIKKAYYTTLNIVEDLVNDPIYFPDGTNLTNTTRVTIPGTNNIQTPENGKKLSCLFASKLNLDTSNGHPTLETFCSTGTGLIFTQDGMVWDMFNCPVAGNNVCRIDISVNQDLANTRYSTLENNCTKFTTHDWGLTSCDSENIIQRVHLVGKAAFFIYPDGEVSLTGPNEFVGYPAGQPLIQDIVNGTTRLLGR